MATRLSPLAANPIEDNYSASVVGQNNVTGRPIVAEPGSTQTVEAVSDSDDYRVGQTVDVSRDRSGTRSGSRRASTRVFKATFTSDSESSQPTQNEPDDTANTTGCKNSFSIKASRNDPPPPEPPPPTPPPDPGNPEPGDEAETTPDPTQPDGCDPQSSSQWYNSPDGSSGCPAGTNYLGFAELGTGVFMVLCEGPSRPPGDGCPYDPPVSGFPQGYDCELGSCVLKPGGRYATLAECQSAGCPTTGYACVGGTCQEVPIANAQYDTLAECEIGGCGSGADGYSCVGGECQLVPGGTYATLQDCYNSGCTTDNEPGVSYRINAFWERQTFNPVSGTWNPHVPESATPITFSTYIGPISFSLVVEVPATNGAYSAYMQFTTASGPLTFNIAGGSAFPAGVRPPDDFVKNARIELVRFP